MEGAALRRCDGLVRERAALCTRTAVATMPDSLDVPPLRLPRGDSSGAPAPALPLSDASAEADGSSDALTPRFLELPVPTTRAVPDHPYASDIDLTGPGSLVQRIDVSRTVPGERALARAAIR